MDSLKKDLTTSGLTMIVIGSCIGSGIFITPSDTVNNVGHHGYVLLIWLIGGIITFLGAMTFSELGSRFPKAGGVYVYLKEAYGELAGFLYGWIILFIVNTGALAALGMALADFMSFFFPLSHNEKMLLAIIVILGLMFMNVLGVKISEIFAKLFTSLKLLALLAIVVLGFSYLGKVDHSIELNLIENVPDNLVSVMIAALVAVFWSFGGWHHATYLSGEAKNPQSTVPRSMLYGTLTVTVVYLLVIYAFMIFLPKEDIAASSRLAGDAVARVIDGGGKLVAIAICISIFGTIGIYTMTAPRIYFAMARDGIFFKQLARIHPRFKTPYVAMIGQAIWAIVLILLWGSFTKIITFVTFMDIVFMALATASIFIFRRKHPDEEVKFKLKWYPIIPIIYLVVTVAFVLQTLFSLRAESLVGVAILLLGIPAFIYFKKKATKNA